MLDNDDVLTNRLEDNDPIPEKERAKPSLNASSHVILQH